MDYNIFVLSLIAINVIASIKGFDDYSFLENFNFILVASDRVNNTE